MSNRKTALSAAIVMCLSITAHAQDAAPAQAAADTGEAVELDKVVVTGIRASLQQSLDTKRNADAIVDVITAEDVGKFPATNVAEAMTIIPGVAIDRAFGQGEKVSILGTDPSLNRTLLNGQSIASGDWNMSEFPTRTFNYSLLAPQLVGKVEVFKSPEARIDEGSIGGTVIISTRKPLDMAKDITIAGQINYVRNDRVEDTDPQASALFGWKNDAGTFGFIVSAQKAKEQIRRDGIESYGTVTAAQFRDGSGGAPGSVGSGNCTGTCEQTLTNNMTAVGPNSMSAHFFEQERDRRTYSASLQFKPVEQLDIELNALKIDSSYDHSTQSMFAMQGNTWNSLSRLTDVTVQNGLMTRGTMNDGLVIFDLQHREASVESETYDLKATWNDERWFASTQLGSTKADGGPRQVFGEFLARADYTWDISNAPKHPGSLTFHGANPFLDPASFQMDAGWGGNVVEKPTLDKEKYGQVDFGLKLDSPVYLLRFGYKKRDHETSQIQRGVILSGVTTAASRFSPRWLPGNYLDGFSGYGDLGRRFTIDGSQLADYILGGEWLPPGQSMTPISTFNSAEFVRNTWSINEDIQAAYVQADFSFGKLRGNVGVRHVRTESENGSWKCSVNVANCAVSQYVPQVLKKKYNNTLPNVNLVYDVNDEFVLRFSAAQVMARPNYADMSSYLWLADATLKGGGGNPDLKPYRSTNLDLSAEWYFSPNSILAGSIFYKDISDYVLMTSGKEDHWNINQNQVSTYDVDRPRNAGDAKVKGAAIAYQQDIGAGFGVLANYTFSDAQANSGRDLPFNSRHQFNISPYFESGNWTARITYGWRDKYFTQVSGGREIWVKDYASLDASVGYRVNDFLSVSLDGMNLLDEEYHSYSGVEQLTRGVYRTGRRFMTSLRVQF
ncbi:TonB-dependent receptor [Pseudoxanthomonas sp. PXM04]|uniref:TonB-dependent receptor n=1 Tax=Pseudoxanthomonas sp. PXM04 TaxID=2769297 RepID=UPI0017848AF0|nr:TonB-dependent receptor [Pseudoxanthomonas sp. PXM04]MBD9377412.1 TonB-dependent receptor [Pseudoxanthomonas sp. PXM04]